MNRRFSDDQKIPFALLSDVEGQVADGFGVRRPKGARWEEVPERRTFLIDPNGIVRVAYDVADVDAHPEQVLKDLTALVGTQA
jgi:peroxiredoxin